MVDPNSSKLDTLETSVDSRPPESYRKFCISHCQDEYDSALSAYEVYDEEDCGHRADNLESCRTGAYFARNVHTGKVKILSSSCHQRWCPMCSATRKWFLSQQISEWLSNVRQPKFLTLTLAHAEFLLEHQIDFLYSCFRKFRQTKLLKDHVRGGVWFFQIHRSKTDRLWHPHLHCVIDSPWIDKFKLSTNWELVTETSKIIDIKEVKDPEKMSEYVARYAARPSMLTGLDIASRHELLMTLHGRRLVGTWGNARSIVLRPSKPPDADDWQKVGYWSQVIFRLDSNENALKIWKAYLSGDECPDDCNCLDALNAQPCIQLEKHRTVDENYLFLMNYY